MGVQEDAEIHDGVVIRSLTMLVDDLTMPEQHAITSHAASL